MTRRRPIAAATRRALPGVVCTALLLFGAERVEACTITSAVGPNFGAYNALTPTPTDSTGSVTLLCAPSDKNIRVDLSPGSSGTFIARTLRQGANQMLYNLYRDAARTSVWGDGTGGSAFLFIANWTGGPNAPQTHIIYGRVPPLQDVAAGSYADTIIVTVLF